MISKENYQPLVVAAAVLTTAILVIFQIYQLREPSRLQADAAEDQKIAEQEGQLLYYESCANCHGDNGQGSVGPALNTKSLLEKVSDDQLFSLILTGVPGTGMPAWGQNFGGPLTDEESRQLVAYIRSWKPSQDEGPSQGVIADPNQGIQIFESICAICHGSGDVGTDRAPALNDQQLLNDFDDDWFRETISQGRPSKGMPTWGTVLSPDQINDLVAMLALWREGEGVEISAEPTETALSGLEIYDEKCAGCHAEGGRGEFGPPLKENPFTASQSDDELIEFILSGQTGSGMPGFENQLSQEQLIVLVDLLRSWQP